MEKPLLEIVMDTEITHCNLCKTFSLQHCGLNPLPDQPTSLQWVVSEKNSPCWEIWASFCCT